MNFEELYTCLFGGEYQNNCDIFVIRSLVSDIYLQNVCRSTLSAFHEKRRYISDTESLPCDARSRTVGTACNCIQ